MLTLAGDGLTVSVLDPRADVARLGSRYVSGGYVWQVTDERHGPLFSGPQFPLAEPSPFHGQGCPEVFETALGQERAAVGEEVYVLGVGRVLRESPVTPFHVRDNPTVTERASWQLEHSESLLRVATVASFAGFECELVRTLRLEGRTLESETEVRNWGELAIQLRWFAHPFFPWPGERVCRLSLESTLPEPCALAEDADGFLRRLPGVSWDAGHYLLPRVALGGELTVEQLHPALGRVRVECRFPLASLALWGNARTFSFEPFFQALLASGQRARWLIKYVF